MALAFGDAGVIARPTTLTCARSETEYVHQGRCGRVHWALTLGREREAGRVGGRGK